LRIEEVLRISPDLGERIQGQGLAVIIYDLNIPCMTGFPLKADSPLVVDPDTVLTLSIPFELLQSVGRWGAKISDLTGIMNHFELPPRTALDVMG
jgi:hypothetical protein